MTTKEAEQSSPAVVATDDATVAGTSIADPVKPHRLVALDAFRGLTMALMVMANAGSAGMYHELTHADWNGWTLADTIFPSFLLIAGVAISLSLGKRLAAGASRAHLFSQVLRRSAVLYLLGIVVYLAPEFSFSTQRLLGVLQRIAICYLIAAAIYLTTRVRGQILWIVGLLAGYWILMTSVPAPGYPAGDLSVAGNLSHYIDKVVLGNHNYRATGTWDPEGVLGTLPSIATALFGILAGTLLTTKKALSERTVWLIIAGNCLLALGLICNVWLPINKHLWTSSFSLFMAGLDFVTFGMFLWLVDGCGYKKIVRPFVILGMNAIAVYMVSEILDELISGIRLGSGATSISIRGWIYHSFFTPFASPANAALAYAFAYAVLMYLVAYALYRKQWFLRV